MAKNTEKSDGKNLHDELEKARQAAAGGEDTHEPAEQKENTKPEQTKSVPEKKKKTAAKQNDSKDSQTKKLSAQIDELTTKLEEANKKLTASTQEAENSKQAHIRTLAEYDNFRKRTAREKEASYGDAKASVIKELLAVLDNIDRAGSVPADDTETYKTGVNMIFSSLTQALEKLGLESFGQAGDTFDPNIHNAVMHVDDEEQGENLISDVFSKGYRLGDRVLRPAMVKVVN